MTLSEYLKICKNFIMPGKKSQYEFMCDFFRNITIECPDELDDEGYYLFESANSKDTAKKVFSGARLLPQKDREFMKSNFDEENLISMLENLDSKTQQHIVDELKEYGIETNNFDLGKTMCNLFLECLNSEEKVNEKGKIPARKLANNEEERKQKNISDYDDDTIDEARRFCIKFSEEKRLLPLCQIAFYLKPMEPHIRELYTEYTKCNKKVREAIMIINEIPIYSFEKDWEYNYLQLFDDDIHKFKLTTQNFLYDGGKYFHNIAYYLEMIPNVMDPLEFPRVPNRFAVKYQKLNLINYIDEYLHYMDDPEIHKYVNEPPMDYLWNNANLAACPEEEMVYWVNLFVYSACIILPRVYGRKDPNSIRHDAPNISELKTMEDLYFVALLYLYELYYDCEKEPAV